MNAMPYISHRLFAAAANREHERAAAFEKQTTGSARREPEARAVQLELVDALPSMPRPMRSARQQI